MAATATQSVIDIRKVCMAFAKPSGESLPVLADIDITLAEGEILGVLGRSGANRHCFASPAGSSKPNSGEVGGEGLTLGAPKLIQIIDLRRTWSDDNIANRNGRATDAELPRLFHE